MLFSVSSYSISISDFYLCYLVVGLVYLGFYSSSESAAPSESTYYLLLFVLVLVYLVYLSSSLGFLCLDLFSTLSACLSNLACSLGRLSDIALSPYALTILMSNRLSTMVFLSLETASTLNNIDNMYYTCNTDALFLTMTLTNSNTAL